MVESKPSCPPEGNEFNIPTNENMGQASNPKKCRGKKLEINQIQSSKLRLTSRAGAMTWKATLLTLYQEHTKNLP